MRLWIFQTTEAFKGYELELWKAVTKKACTSWQFDMSLERLRALLFFHHKAQLSDELAIALLAFPLDDLVHLSHRILDGVMLRNLPEVFCQQLGILGLQHVYQGCSFVQPATSSLLYLRCFKQHPFKITVPICASCASSKKKRSSKSLLVLSTFSTIHLPSCSTTGQRWMGQVPTRYPPGHILQSTPPAPPAVLGPHPCPLPTVQARYCPWCSPQTSASWRQVQLEGLGTNLTTWVAQQVLVQ